MWSSCQGVDRRPQRILVGLTALIVVVASALMGLAGAAGARSSPPSSRPGPVPQGFVGVDVNSPMLEPGTSLNTNRQMTSMVQSGVESIRVAFNWAAMQTWPKLADVPPDQRADVTVVPETVPTDFTGTDQLVGDAARHGLTVLPTVLYAPYWDARANKNGIATPLRPGPYAAFAAVLVKRYGPRGSFWSQNPGIPRHPIHMWQIWNEPNLSYYWHQPFAKGYVQLLRAAHAAIKKADPSAKVVLGALTNLAWKAIGQVYATGGNIRSQFDIVSVNGFTRTPSDVMLYLKLMHRALHHYHDPGKPLLDTEMSWPSASGQTHQYNDFNVTPSGQARNLGAVLPQLGAQRKALNLIGFFYYTWIGEEYKGAPAFNFAGLLRLRRSDQKVEVKPALGTYRRGVLRLEGCRAKGSVATRCLH